MGGGEIMKAGPHFTIVVLVLAHLFSGLAAAAEDQLVLSARPSSKVESGPDATQQFVLTSAQAQEFAVTIIKRGDRYFWAHTVSGIYHHFIDR